MDRGQPRTWALLGAVAALLAVGGCDSSSPGDEGGRSKSPSPRDPGLPSEEKIAAATNKYLKGDGALLVRLHRDAAGLPGKVDGDALGEKCKGLRGTLGDRYPAKKLLGALQGVPDPVAGRLWTTELDAMLSAVESCAVGEEGKARRSAKLTATAAQRVEGRLDELRKVGDER
ncbi:hypothetical protein [Streptomyces boninensis]|uniref:hypothetical protein n=1 Tax=Streptomyces boninensis TaxID=2039455 RepID=UPI003B21BFB0